MADLAELSEQVRSALCFVPVSHMDEVLDTALLPLPAVAAADPAAPGRPHGSFADGRRTARQPLYGLGPHVPNPTQGSRI